MKSKLKFFVKYLPITKDDVIAINEGMNPNNLHVVNDKCIEYQVVTYDTNKQPRYYVKEKYTLLPDGDAVNKSIRRAYEKGVLPDWTKYAKDHIVVHACGAPVKDDSKTIEKSYSLTIKL